jgi:hypothetical protein
MKMTSAAEMKSREGTTWLIYGTFGVGKTPFASAFPDPWIWDCEAGSSSVLVEMPITVIESWTDVMTVTQALQTSKDHQVKLQNHAFICKTVIIDTVGEMSRIIVNSAKGSKETATLPDWGMMVERVRNTTRHLRNMRSLGFNIVFICHEQYLKQNESEIVMGLPDLPGKELPIDLPKLCDFVVRMRVRRNAQGKLERIINTAPDGQFVARDRSGKLAETEIIDLSDLKQIQALLTKAGVNYN